MEDFKLYFLNDQQLPLVVEPIRQDLTLSDAFALIQKHEGDLKNQLLKYGGILFRNFPVQNEDDFSSFIANFKAGRFVDYIGGDSPRDKVKGGVYTSTEAPPSLKIPLHNELSFVKRYPKHIYFYCHIEPKAGGETIIADARKVFRGIDGDVRNRFVEKGLKYVSCYYGTSFIMELLNKWQRSHKSWMQVFETDSRDEVERKCRLNEFEYQWTKNGWIEVSQTRPAVMKHPITHEDIWFNQAHLYDFNPRLLGLWRYLGAKLFYFQKHTRLHEMFFADGTSIPRKDLYHVMDVLDNCTIYFPWQKGDVLMLDNVLAMHGRAPFEGKRRILTAMTE